MLYINQGLIQRIISRKQPKSLVSTHLVWAGHLLNSRSMSSSAASIIVIRGYFPCKALATDLRSPGTKAEKTAGSSVAFLIAGQDDMHLAEWQQERLWGNDRATIEVIPNQTCSVYLNGIEWLKSSSSSLNSGKLSGKKLPPGEQSPPAI